MSTNSSKSLAAVVARLERNAVSSCLESEEDLEEDRLALGEEEDEEEEEEEEEEEGERRGGGEERRGDMEER